MIQVIKDKKFIDHIHHECLFFYGSGNEVVQMKDEGSEVKEKAPKTSNKRCHTVDARRAAYDFLN